MNADKQGRLTETEIMVIKAMADNRLRVMTAARSIPGSHMLIRYNVDKIKAKTGLDPHDFWEMTRLLEMIREQEAEDGPDS